MGVADQKIAVGALREHEIHVGLDQLGVIALEALAHGSCRRTGDEGAVAEQGGACQHGRLEVSSCPARHSQHVELAALHARLGGDVREEPVDVVADADDRAPRLDGSCAGSHQARLDADK